MWSYWKAFRTTKEYFEGKVKSGEESSTYYDKHINPNVKRLTRGTIQSTFVYSDSFDSHKNLMKQVLLSHFTDKKIEAQRG